MMAQLADDRCPGPVGRRTWLQVDGLSLGALAVGANPNLARLLAAAEQADGKRAVSQDFSVILFWANGGPSHLDLFDLKPQVNPTQSLTLRESSGSEFSNVAEARRPETT